MRTDLPDKMVTRVALLLWASAATACATQPRHDESPLAIHVSKLVDETTKSKRRQARALSHLEALGRPAVPYIVRHLNDRRRLAESYMRLTNKAVDAFEAFRQYRPVEVKDALPHLLNQMTGESFDHLGIPQECYEDYDSERRAWWLAWCIDQFDEYACGAKKQAAY